MMWDEEKALITELVGHYFRRSESGLRLLHGTWEGVCRYGDLLTERVVGGERECVEQQKL